MEAMLWMLNLAWKILLLIIGWKTLKYITKNGGETFQEVLNTTGMAIRAGCAILRRKVLQKLSKGTVEKTETQTEDQALDEKSDAVKVEATVV